MDNRQDSGAERFANPAVRPAGAHRLIERRRGPRARAAELFTRGLVGASDRCERALRVATSFIGHSLSSARFCSGLDPLRFFDDYLAWRPVFGSLRRGLTVDIDPARRTTTTDVYGLALTRTRFHDRLGTLAEHGDGPHAALPAAGRPAPREPGPLKLPDGPARVMGAADERLFAILARALGPGNDGRASATKALLVVRDGAICGEAYAEGYGPATPIIGYSLAKTLCNALAGRMTQACHLTPGERDLCPEWTKPGDRRRDITIDHLLRMTSGLRFPETHSGFDPVSHMLFLSCDMGAFAARAPLEHAPGERFDYTCGNTMVFARLARERLGTGPDGVWQFLDRELLAPLGMEHMLVEFDRSGTPILSTFCYASARDWARLGLLYLNDGCAGAKRLLPEGWVARSAAATVEPSYGAGLRINRRGGQGDRWLVPGLPEGSYYAHGHLGQYVVVIPALGAVIVRLGASPGAMRGHDAAILRDIAAAIAG